MWQLLRLPVEHLKSHREKNGQHLPLSKRMWLDSRVTQTITLMHILTIAMLICNRWLSHSLINPRLPPTPTLTRCITTQVHCTFINTLPIKHWRIITMFQALNDSDFYSNRLFQAVHNHNMIALPFLE